MKLGPRLQRANESSDDELARDYVSSESEEEEGDVFSIGSEEDAPPRRSSRSNVKKLKQSKLPFSPKKTRSRGPVSSHNATRRSTRAVNKRTVILDDEAYEDPESEGTEYDSVKPKKKKNVKKAKKAPRGYGLVHEGQAAFDEDPAGVETHRSICEKCHRTPTHLLLEAAKKKPKGRKGRKKKEEDDFEDDENEEDRVASLGGWVRWYVLSNDAERLLTCLCE